LDARILRRPAVLVERSFLLAWQSPKQLHDVLFFFPTGATIWFQVLEYGTKDDNILLSMTKHNSFNSQICHHFGALITSIILNLKFVYPQKKKTYFLNRFPKLRGFPIGNIYSLANPKYFFSIESWFSTSTNNHSYWI
jgi:hypothetical protein